MFRWLMPHTNLHELNLDWIISTVKSMLETVEPLAATVTDLQVRTAELESDVASLSERVAVLESGVQRIIYSGVPVCTTSTSETTHKTVRTYTVQGVEVQDAGWQFPGGAQPWDDFRIATDVHVQVGADRYTMDQILEDRMVGHNDNDPNTTACLVTLDTETGVLTFNFTKLVFPAVNDPDYEGMVMTLYYGHLEP